MWGFTIHLHLHISNMLSRLEQAITDVLNTNQTPDFDNVLAAYKLHCDKKQLQHAQVYFQIAMDKYPDATEKKQSPYAPLITSMRKDYFESSIDAAVSLFGPNALLPCPCDCGALLDVAQFREQLDIMFEPVIGKIHLRRAVIVLTTSFDECFSDQCALSESGRIKKRRRTTRKAKRSVKRDTQPAKVAFDPFGPSTSRAST